MLNILNALIKAKRDAYIKRRIDIEKRAEELNAGWAQRWNRGEMTIMDALEGADGRLHAPCDGFMWEHPQTGNVDTYGGGQYLPYVDDIKDDMLTFGYWKLRVTDEMLHDIRETGEFDVCTPYKSWTINGHTVHMVEIKGDKSFLEAIQTYSQEWFEAYYIKERSNKGEAPMGKVRIKGVVRSAKQVNGYYGPQVKMTVVLENGATVYGTMPSALHIDYRGEIEFNATFERAADDNTHAFFKRPTKVEVCTTTNQ